MRSILSVFTFVIFLISCGGNNSSQKRESSSHEKVSLTAAGATFPLPFYNLSFKEYTKSKGTLLTYGGIGSGGGIRSLKDKVVDFGATDAFLSDKKEAEMPAKIVHIPTCIGAVVVAFNLPNIDSLNLTNKNLEDIFMGSITKWNDERLKATNPDIDFPNIDITVAHRSDGSGTTYIFSDYMSKISKKWKQQVGRGKSLKWPVGLSAKGNPGVAGMIKQTVGSIGYIGSEFAFAQKIAFAKIKNSSGNFIKPSLKSISAAAMGDIPSNTKVMLTNSAAIDAYPISGFTWLILYKEQNYDNRSKKRAQELLKFLSWIIGKDAQALAQRVNYAVLPQKAIENAKNVLKSVTYNGKPILH